jgi:hypothetical protein
MKGKPLKFKKPVLLLACAAVLFAAVPALAEYLGPDRTETTYTWERLGCHYQAVYDPPGPGWYGCSLSLYDAPDAACPSTNSINFNPSGCTGWPGSCTTLPCAITLTESIEPCTEGQFGCRLTAQTSLLPEAAISADLQGCVLNNGWCASPPLLALSADEPLAGYHMT